MNTLINSGADSAFALMPSTHAAFGRGRLSGAGYAMTGTSAFLHQEKTGPAVSELSALSAVASNAQTTDLRGIPPRGSAPV